RITPASVGALAGAHDDTSSPVISATPIWINRRKPPSAIAKARISAASTCRAERPRRCFGAVGISEAASAGVWPPAIIRRAARAAPGSGEDNGFGECDKREQAQACGRSWFSVFDEPRPESKIRQGALGVACLPILRRSAVCRVPRALLTLTRNEEPPLTKVLLTTSAENLKL